MNKKLFEADYSTNWVCKARYRRGLAYKGKGSFYLALMDFQMASQFQPNNEDVKKESVLLEQNWHILDSEESESYLKKLSPEHIKVILMN